MIACLAQFMVVLDATVVNIALPSVQRGLHFSAANLQWIVNGYTLIFGGFLLLGGRAADLLGRKRLFVAGVVLFSVASLINGFAQTSGMLIVGRGLQGLGGALVSPAALSIVTTTFTDGDDRTKALGVWSAIAAGGAAVGLLMGGVLTDIASWRWVFFVNIPVGVATVLSRCATSSESRLEVAHRTFDVAGAVAVTAGLVVLVYTIVKAQAYGWGSAADARPGRGRRSPCWSRFLVIEHRSAGPADAAARSSGSARWRWPTRRCCSSPRRCSGCSSSPRCTCRRSSATARCGPAWPSCRSRAGIMVGAGARPAADQADRRCATSRWPGSPWPWSGCSC